MVSEQRIFDLDVKELIGAITRAQSLAGLFGDGHALLDVLQGFEPGIGQMPADHAWEFGLGGQRSHLTNADH